MALENVQPLDSQVTLVGIQQDAARGEQPSAQNNRQQERGAHGTNFLGLGHD